MDRHMIVLCIAVVSSMACFLVQGSPVQHFDTQPQKCCISKQYSVHMTQLESINNDAVTILDMQMDYDRKQQVMLNYTVSPGSGSKTLVSKVLIDYAKEMLYSVPASQPDLCYKMSLSLPFVHCIPDDAQYLGSDYLGPMEASHLPYDGWRMRFPSVKNKPSSLNVVYTLAVSKKDCVPIVEGVAYPDNPSQNTFFMFSGFKPELTDPSQFKLPASCFK